MPALIKQPRVTLGVTTYNVERYLAGAFDAILAQDFPDFEVVVCDNLSDDSTWDICQTYAAKDDRFRIFRNDANIGMAANFNRVVSLARGEYFRLTAHDDRMDPKLLSRCVEALDAEPEAVLAHTVAVIIDDDGEESFVCDEARDLRQPRASARIAALLGTWSLCNEMLGLVRTDVLRQTRLMSAHLPSSDRRMLIELAARGAFVLVPEPLFYRRIGQSSSYGGEHGVPTYQWLEPEAARRGVFPKRFARMNGDANRLTVEVLRALLGSDLPWSRRLESAMTFGTLFPARRAKAQVGRWKRRVMRAR